MSAQGPCGARPTMAPFNVFETGLDGLNLIEASAGTGKTWNLSALVVRLLVEARLDIDRILIVTFTEAATAELRERVRSRLRETLDHLRREGTPPPDAFATPLREAWARRGIDEAQAAAALERALVGFDEAAVFTIHGFCRRALADTPLATGLPVSQTLLKDDRALRSEVTHDFWRRRVAGAPTWLAAALRQGRDTPETWKELLRERLQRPLARMVWPPEALGPTPAAPQAAGLQARFDHARQSWQGRRHALLDAVRASLGEVSNAQHFHPEALEEAARQWDDLLTDADVAVAASRCGSLKKAVLLARGRFRAKKGKVLQADDPFFDETQALLDGMAELAAEVQVHRLHLLREFLETAPDEVRRKRREARVITYDDMLLNLHERLTGPQADALALRLRERFPAALIDEFQDTDPLQWSVFSHVYGGPSTRLFLVGDPKQAIYGFRNADLRTYLGAREAVRSAGAVYALHENQRADRGLMEAVNALFSRHPRAFMLEGLDFHDAAFGRKPRAAWHDGTGVPRGSLHLWRIAPTADGLPPTRAQAVGQAAQACAAEIARLLQGGRAGQVTVGGRPLTGGQVAVLVRSHRQGRQMREALRAVGVDSVLHAQDSVFTSPDAEALAAVLAAVLEPSNEALVRAALATPVLGVDAAGLLALEDDEEALPALMQRFAGHRERWLRHGVAAMWQRLMAQERVRERLLARSDGARRLTNVLHLVEHLHLASQAGQSPAELLRWLGERRRQDAETEEAEQLRLETDQDLVQVVTIHRAKGLEYPVVFCPFAFSSPTGGKGDRWCTAHAPDGSPTLHFTGVGDPALKADRARAEAEEELRLLYVALTRAVHRCVLVCGLYRDTRRDSTLKPARASLLHWLVAGHGRDPATWMGSPAEAPAVQAAWEALEASSPGHIILEPLPVPSASAAQGTSPPPSKAPVFEALPPPRLPPAGWWFGSYSRLVHGARPGTAEADHDTRAEGGGAAPGRDRQPPPDLDEDDVLGFPAGAEAGHCLHAAFEVAEFTDPDSWAGAADHALRTRALRLGDVSPARARAMLARALQDVLDTPMAGGLRLREVGPHQRCAEMEFTLPAGALDARALRQALADHGYPAPELGPAALRGMLRGFIDLVFEHGGRWYVLDWKSNHLGFEPAAYGAEAMRAEMAHHHYTLQSLLYTVALHRHLGQRLPGYRYEEHFGGILYLFVRGVRPQWRQPDGSPAGVHFDLAPRALVDTLSDLFCAQGLWT